jgi:hypothetical protein
MSDYSETIPSPEIVRVLPERVLAAALALPCVKITSDEWLVYCESETRCCGMGLVALSEGLLTIPAYLEEMRSPAAELERALGVSESYRRGYDLGFAGAEVQEHDLRPEARSLNDLELSLRESEDHIAQGHTDGLAARSILIDKIDDPERYAWPNTFGFPDRWSDEE